MSIQIVEHKFSPVRALSYRKRTTEIILHCTATPEGRDLTVESIDRDHKRNRGWNMIAYQYVIYRDGSVHRGRPETAVGGHCTNHNSLSIGISYVGGMDADNKKAKDTRTWQQECALYDLVHYLLTKYNLPLSAVHCHNEFAAKACPSFSRADFIAGYTRYIS